MKSNNSIEILKSAPINTLIKKFTLPAIISMLITAIYNIVDQVYLGNLIGPHANAATTVAFPVIIITLSFAVLFAVGSSVHISTLLGDEKIDKAKDTFNIIFLVLTIVSILFTFIGLTFIDSIIALFGAKAEIYEYSKIYTSIILLGTWANLMIIFLEKILRCDAAPTFSMFVTLLGAVINVILDPILITILGIAGAAIATIISQYISALSMLIYLQKRGNFKLILNDFFNITKEKLLMIKNCIYFGSSSFIYQLSSVLMQTIVNRSLVKYGDLDPTVGGVIALAAVGVVLKFSMIIISICIGIGVGCQPIISYNNGAKQYNRVKEVYKKSVLIVFAITSILWIFIQLAPSVIINIFDNSSPAFHTFGIRALRYQLSAFFLVGINIVSTIFFQSIGKPLLSGMLSFIRLVILIIPLILILPIFIGLDGILLSSPIAEIITFIFVIITINKVLKGLNNEQI